MKFNCTRIEEENFPLLESWYSKYDEQMMPWDFFPVAGTGGYIVWKGDTPIAAMWMWVTNSRTAIPAVVISDKVYREEDRSDALQYLIDYTSAAAHKAGAKYCFAWAKKGVLLDKYMNSGYIVDDTPSHELMKIWDK